MSAIQNNSTCKEPVKCELFSRQQITNPVWYVPDVEITRQGFIAANLTMLNEAKENIFVMKEKLGNLSRETKNIKN